MDILLMEKIMHQIRQISNIPSFLGFHTSQVVQVKVLMSLAAFDVRCFSARNDLNCFDREGFLFMIKSNCKVYASNCKDIIFVFYVYTLYINTTILYIYIYVLLDACYNILIDEKLRIVAQCEESRYRNNPKILGLHELRPSTQTLRKNGSGGNWNPWNCIFGSWLGCFHFTLSCHSVLCFFGQKLVRGFGIFMDFQLKQIE